MVHFLRARRAIRGLDEQRSTAVATARELPRVRGRRLLSQRRWEDRVNIVSQSHAYCLHSPRERKRENKKREYADKSQSARPVATSATRVALVEQQRRASSSGTRLRGAVRSGVADVSRTSRSEAPCCPVGWRKCARIRVDGCCLSLSAGRCESGLLRAVSACAGCGWLVTCYGCSSRKVIRVKRSCLLPPPPTLTPLCYILRGPLPQPPTAPTHLLLPPPGTSSSAGAPPRARSPVRVASCRVLSLRVHGTQPPSPSRTAVPPST